MTNYLHGSETEEQSTINLTIQNADISNICIIGTKPTYLIDDNEDINHIVNFTESAKYVGNNIEGFTLPDAVETVLTESGGASIYTINIFDKDKHCTEKSKSFQTEDNTYTFEDENLYDLKINAQTQELVEGVDYNLENSTITVNDAFKNVVMSAMYKCPDFDKILDSDVIGGVDANGKRSGIQKIYDIIATYGITPGIIITPGFYSKNIRNAVETIADKIGGFYYGDCNPDTTVPLAEKARNAEISGVDLTGSSERSGMCCPWVNRYNSFENKTALKPLSPVVAGLRVKLDRERNVAKSIDNTKSKTIISTKFPVSFLINDPTTDSNRLNKLGIITAINYKGDYYVWGGRNMSYPNKTGLMTFESARRTRDYIVKSIQETSFVCVGETITRGFIDDILNAINSAFARWSNPANTSEHIIYDGEAYWDESLNTAEKLADGHIYFPYKYCPLATAERITFHDILDITIITKTLNT